jgi:hypothetical protein
MVETKIALSIFAKPSNFYSFCKNHEIHSVAKTKVFTYFRNINENERFCKSFRENDLHAVDKFFLSKPCLNLDEK